MNGPDLIALKSDDPRQKASTRPFNARHPQFPTRRRGSSPILSRPKKKNPRGLCLAGVSSHWPAACVSAHEACASPTPPSGAEERPPRPACGTAAVRRGRLKGLRPGRAAQAAEGATRTPCAVTCAVGVRRGTRPAGAGEGAPACGAPSTAGLPRGVGPRLDNRPPTASRTGKGLRTHQRLDDLLQIGRGARLAAGQAQLGAAASAREPNPRRLAPPGRFQRRPQRPTPHQRPDGTADSAPPPAAVSARRIALDLSKLNPVVLAVLNRSTTSWRSSMRSCRPT